MINKNDVIINTVGGCSSSCERKTPEGGRDKSPLLPPPPPGFPPRPRVKFSNSSGPSLAPRKKPYLDTDLRLGVGPHAPCTEEQGGAGLQLPLHQDGGMLEEMCKCENDELAVKILKEKDEEIARLERRVRILEQMNHMLRVTLENVKNIVLS